MLHPEFDGGRRARALDWIEAFAARLRARGFEARKFDARADRLTDFDWIHAFWGEEAETWASIQGTRVPISVTPSLQPGFPQVPDPVIDRGLRVARGLIQRRWPPVDEMTFRALPERYFVVDEVSRQRLMKFWNLPTGKVQVSGPEPETAADMLANHLRERTAR
jgi:hypothetical protein